MKRLLLVVFIIFNIQTNFAAEANWGKNGHRAVAEIAQSYLKPKAKKAISKLLNGRSLAFVANYADDIKSDPAFRKYSPWHYVNIDPDEDEYNVDKANPKGDLVQAIRKCVEILEDDDATKDDKRFYLKLLVHFMGDLHQPLHAGHSKDKGGNDIQVNWFGHGSNLHRVWDSDMIESYDMSYSELADNTREYSKEQLKAIRKGDLLDWVYESRELAEKVYASAKSGDSLGYEYMYNEMPVVLQQLDKGGIRLAKVLNEIFE